MPAAQTWDPNTYAKNARFVSDLGSPVLELLAPKSGERILDLGCGDGVLTKKLVDCGCTVVAVDSSAPQIEAARRLGLDAYVMNGEELPYESEFDAVFSNAVLHWIQRPDAVRGDLPLATSRRPLRGRVRRTRLRPQDSHRAGRGPQPQRHRR